MRVAKLLMLCAALWPIPGRAAESDVLDLVFLGPKRPLLIRLHIRVDGQSYRAAFDAVWNTYLRALFRYLDRDGDGFLSPEEAARAPAPPLILPGPWHAGPNDAVHFAFNFAVLDANGDGKVSFDEFATYYREYGGSALRQQFAGRTAATDSADQALIQRLDRSHTGRLTHADLAVAADALFALDADGNELLTPEEISGGDSAPRPATATANPLPENASFFVVDGPDSLAELAGALKKRYRRAVDAETDWARRSPDAEIIVRLGPVPAGQPAVSIVPAKNRQQDSAISVRELGGTIVLMADGTIIELIRNVGPIRIPPEDRRIYLHQFKAAERQGTVDRRGAARYPFLATFFDIMDRNGDGKLDEKEVAAFLDEVHTPLLRALARRTALLMSDEGRGLFDLLDQNRDGRLGLRELRQAPRLLDRLNRAADGFIATADIPRSYRLALGLGQASFSPHGGNIVVVPVGDMTEAAASLGVGPLWFRKMDRNHDGDVSPNEFLGTLEEFCRLDKDGDGLISVEEAEQADARLRHVDRHR